MQAEPGNDVNQWVATTFGSDPTASQDQSAPGDTPAPTAPEATADPAPVDVAPADPPDPQPDPQLDPPDPFAPKTPVDIDPAVPDPLAGPDDPGPVPLDGAKGRVTAVALISSSSGALSGFPSTPSGANANSPGPFNNKTTGSCEFVFQVKFTLDGISSNDMDLLRTMSGSAGPVASPAARTGNDGPSDPFKQRGKDYIAVADTPGIKRADRGFPLMYKVSFKLFAFDRVSKKILATASYTVNVLKQTVDDPNPVCEVTGFSSTIA